MDTPAGLVLQILELVQSVNGCPLSRGTTYEANGLGLVLAELGSILADGPFCPDRAENRQIDRQGPR